MTKGQKHHHECRCAYCAAERTARRRAKHNQQLSLEQAQLRRDARPDAREVRKIVGQALIDLEVEATDAYVDRMRATRGAIAQDWRTEALAILTTQHGLSLEDAIERIERGEVPHPPEDT